MEAIIDTAFQDGQATHEIVACGRCGSTWPAHALPETRDGRQVWRINPACPSCAEATVVAHVIGDAQSWMAPEPETP